MSRFLFAVFVLCSSSLLAQDYSRIEVFGGYSYLNIDPNDLSSSRQSANGWRAAVSVNAHRRFALEGDVSGYYKNYSEDLSGLGLGSVNVGVHDYAFLGGPRINFRPFFVHALVGVDRLTETVFKVSASQNGFASAFGGGLQWKIARNWSVQGSGDYVLTRHNVFGGDRFSQNNVRVAAGIVYSFGHVGPVAAPRDRARSLSTPKEHGDIDAPATTGSVPIPALGLEASTNEHGALVTDVIRLSLAAQAGIRPGDIITAVNGQPVKTSLELAAACLSLSSGPAKVGYLAHGYWQAETTILMPAH